VKDSGTYPQEWASDIIHALLCYVVLHSWV
jgi:hypothetical protein